MSIGAHIQAWREHRGRSVAEVAAKAGLAPAALEAIESGATDPNVSTLDALASALGIPASWLFADPAQVDLLTTEPDGEDGDPFPSDCADPVVERILRGRRHDPTLYVLLTALLQSEDEKLIRAAEVSLRSLLKQSRTAPLPWQNRRPGNFDPPSD